VTWRVLLPAGRLVAGVGASASTHLHPKSRCSDHDDDPCCLWTSTCYLIWSRHAPSGSQGAQTVAFLSNQLHSAPSLLRSRCRLSRPYHRLLPCQGLVNLEWNSGNFLRRGFSQSITTRLPGDLVDVIWTVQMETQVAKQSFCWMCFRNND